MRNQLPEDLVEKIEHLPLLSADLPCSYGGSTIDHIELSCAGCGEDLAPDRIRGSLSAVNSRTVSLEGYGVCYTCRTLTPVAARFRNDGTFLFKSGNCWKQGTWSKRNCEQIGLKYLAPAIALLVVACWILFTN